VREVRDFHKATIKVLAAFLFTPATVMGETPRLARSLRETVLRPAPNPVMGLWTGCTRLKTQIVTKRDFPLTKKIESVQQDRSLTAS
jgi:hypothetical protein